MDTNENWQSREISLIGKEAVERLKEASVLVFGVGGVGGYAVEALARAGVGRISIVDSDRFCPSNMNRQLLADVTTLGKVKTEVAEERIKKINPECEVVCFAEYADGSNIERIFDTARPEFVIDCIDSVGAKLCIAKTAIERNIGIIACMGTGNKLDPSKLRVSDISKTVVCPLAKAVRLGFKKLGIKHLPVVFSDEIPVKSGQRTPASISFVPPVAGFLLSGYVIRRLIGIE